MPDLFSEFHNDLEERAGRLSGGRGKDDAFVTWFLDAEVLSDQEMSADEQAARRCLTDKSGEKGIDAVHLSAEAKVVYVVQGKLNRTLRTKHDKNEVGKFKAIVEAVIGSEEAFEEFTLDLAEIAKQKLTEARHSVKKQNYELRCVFVTTGSITANAVKQTQSACNRIARNNMAKGEEPSVKIIGYDRHWVLARYQDYLEGAAPATDYIEIETDTQPYEVSEAQLPTFLLSVSGSSISESVRREGGRLFRRNIRDPLGETKVNSQIRETLLRNPERFFFLNNGLTILAEGVRDERDGGRRVVTLERPQIINGQQTAWTLSENPGAAAQAQVLVRVFEVSRATAAFGGWDDYDQMVSDIVRATNSSNPIKQSDLRANDAIQISLERRLRDLADIYYLRRSTSAKRAKRAAGDREVIRMVEFARANQATRDAYVALRGPEGIFEDAKLYRAVFGRGPSISATRAALLLSRYYVFKCATSVAWGSTERQWARFVAVENAWRNEFERSLGTQVARKRFCEAFADGREPEHKAVQKRVETILRNYISAANKQRTQAGRDRKRRGLERPDAVKFAKERETYSEFPAFWRSSSCSTERGRVGRAVRELRNVLG